MSIKLKDLPIEMQKKYVGQIDTDGMIRVQYYPEDLCYALDMSDTKIADMYVELINNIQVLRIVAIPIDKKEDFKTVRVAPKDQTKQSVRRKQTPIKGISGPGPVTRAPKLDTEQPFKPANKLIEMGKAWMKKKDKPGFMKDAGF
jgi:hypothetical protein